MPTLHIRNSDQSVFDHELTDLSTWSEICHIRFSGIPCFFSHTIRTDRDEYDLLTVLANIRDDEWSTLVWRYHDVIIELKSYILQTAVVRTCAKYQSTSTIESEDREVISIR